MVSDFVKSRFLQKISSAFPNLGTGTAGGASDGNRTHATSLEGWNSTIELHSQTRILQGFFRVLAQRLYIIPQAPSFVNTFLKIFLKIFSFFQKAKKTLEKALIHIEICSIIYKIMGQNLIFTPKGGTSYVKLVFTRLHIRQI